MAALDGCSVSYRDRSENAKRSAAQKRQEQRLAANIPDDLTALQVNLARGKYYYTVLCILIILQLHNYCRKTATSSQSVSKKLKRVEQPEISDDDEDFERPRR